ncbi:Polyadenylate-binding protein, cytoplasmic and nuclear [Yarrowia sp. C11]|nr:Polyadenylate-binding protein, cytoplasmic and nuclear [Yarrowia sp. C11]KAG5363915.1 Polyadenylate-binding protein, cytoplasmic and nuclear [Yarrowia sp. E02]
MSIYVANLPGTVSEADLFELFKQHGPLKVIKIPRDPKLRTPLGHAYVTFYNPDHAQIAQEALKEAIIGGQQVSCSITDQEPVTMSSTTSPSSYSPVDPSRSVFVRDTREGVDPATTKTALESLGAVSLQPKGPNAFVAVFPTPEDATKALTDELDNLEISPVRDPKTFYTNLFVRGLSPDTTEEVLRQEFERHGEVTSLLLPLDEMNRAKGFGFVNFAEHRDAVAALEALDGSVMCGAHISVSRAQSKVERQAELKRAYEANRIERLRNARGTNLYITNLNPAINNERLRAYFSKFGEITSVRIMLDAMGNSKGFGFVCFRDPDHASNAIAEMHNRPIEGNVLQVAIAHKKDPQSAPYSLGKRFPQQVPPNVHPGVPMHAMAPMHAGGVPNMQMHPHMQPHMMHPMGHMGPMVPMHMAPVMVPPQQSPQPRRDSRDGSAGNGVSGGGAGNSNGSSKFKKRQPLLQPYGNIAASVAAAATPQAAKEIVGETLYPIVQRHPAIGKNADTTAHVTGIMLQHDNADILSWLEDEQLLNKRIQQASDAYKEWLEEKEA